MKPMSKDIDVLIVTSFSDVNLFPMKIGLLLEQHYHIYSKNVETLMLLMLLLPDHSVFLLLES